MKACKFLLIVVITLICSTETRAQSDDFRIIGKVSSSPTTFALLYSDAGIDTIAILTDGSISFKKQLEKSEYATLMIPKTRLYLGLWIQNGRIADVTIDANDLSRVTVRGDIKAENDFFLNENNSIAAWTSDAKDFSHFCKDWTNFSDSVIAVAAKIGNSDFTSYQKEYLAQNGDTRKVNYYTRLLKQNKAVDVDNDYNDYMESVDINSEDNTRKELIFHYLKWKALAQGDHDGSYAAMLKVLGKSVTSQIVRDEYAFRLFRMQVASHEKYPIDSIYHLALHIASGKVRQNIDKFYLNSIRPQGSVIADFRLLDINEKDVSFHNICDKKVIFVDVWSTWCVPCVAEIPHVAKLVERYKDNPNVKFVSLSIDKNKGNWKKFIEKKSMKWEQYNVPYEEQRAFLDRFAINGIPRFMIFGKGATVMNMNAPAPSDKELVKLIEQYSSK